MISIRKFAPSDTEEVLRLFYSTVHTVNSLDYSPEQLEAWAPDQPDYKKWRTILKESKTLIAESDGRIAGFADLENDGTSVGMLYVHKDHQRKGIATLLLNRLEKKLAKRNIPVASVEASLTARPFFEQRGYRFVRENRKQVNGVEFLNYIMEKKLPLKEKKKMKNKSKGKKSWRGRGLTISKSLDLLIVIVGVTIAIQLYAWMNASNQRTQERYYLESILLDLDRDMKEYNEIMQDLQQDATSINGYLRKAEQPAPPLDSLGMIIVNTLRFKRFEGNQNTYSMLTGSKDLGAIADPAIRSQLTDYYKHYVMISRFEEVYTDLLFQMNDYFLPYCDYSTMKIMDTTVVTKLQTRNYFMLANGMLEDGTETYTGIRDKAGLLRRNLEAKLEKSK